MKVKTYSLLTFRLSSLIGWVPAILWPGSLSHLQVEVMGWVDRASKGTSEGPGHDAGCQGFQGCRVGGSSTTPWWSVPETSGRDGRRRRRTLAGSPPHKCLRWRRKQKHVLRPGLQRRGTAAQVKAVRSISRVFPYHRGLTGFKTDQISKSQEQPTYQYNQMFTLPLTDQTSDIQGFNNITLKH